MNLPGVQLSFVKMAVQLKHFGYMIIKFFNHKGHEGGRKVHKEENGRVC